MKRSEFRSIRLSAELEIVLKKEIGSISNPFSKTFSFSFSRKILSSIFFKICFFSAVFIFYIIAILRIDIISRIYIISRKFNNYRKN